MGCNCRCDCTGIGIIIGIIIGVIAGVFAFLVPISLTFVYWFLIGFAFLALLTAAVLAALVGRSPGMVCLCRVMPMLKTGIIGTTLVSVIALILDFFVASIVFSAILFGLAALFAVLIFAAFYCLLICMARCDRTE